MERKYATLKTKEIKMSGNYIRFRYLQASPKRKSLLTQKKESVCEVQD